MATPGAMRAGVSGAAAGGSSVGADPIARALRLAAGHHCWAADEARAAAMP
ncbi:hypothetical protein ACU4GD_33175 [Cupriavidus basilensis]